MVKIWSDEDKNSRMYFYYDIVLGLQYYSY